MRISPETLPAMFCRLRNFTSVLQSKSLHGLSNLSCDFTGFKEDDVVLVRSLERIWLLLLTIPIIEPNPSQHN